MRIVDLARLDAYATINEIIKNDIGAIVLPSKIFQHGLKLHRCRNNYNDEVFQTIDGLSFRNDLEEIVDFGRANEPKQSIFYSADVRPTAISETNKAFRGENYKDIEEISITTSHWESIADLKLTLIIGNKSAQEKNELIKRFSIDIDSLTAKLFGKESENIFEILNYISDEFAFNTNENINLYKISCAFAQLAYKESDGIIYPSIQRNLEGLNFAIKPDSVMKKLRFVNATHDVFKKVGEMNYQHCETKDTVRVENSKLIWGETREIASP